MSSLGVHNEPSLEDAAELEGRDWTPGSIYALAFLSLIYSFNAFDRNLFGMLIPLIKSDFQLTDTALALISGLAFILFYSLAGVPIGRLADVGNRRNIIAIGFTFWSLVTAISGLATNVWHLLILRFLQGAGEAAGVPPSQSMVSDIFSKRRRPLALAIISGGAAITGLVFTPLAGVIAERYGWRMAFLAAGAPGVILGLIFWMSVPEPSRGATEAKGANLDPANFMESLGFLLRQWAFVLVLIGGGIFGIVTAINFTWSVAFLVRVHHLSMSQIGFTVGPIRGLIGAGAGILGAVIAQRMSKRDERWALWVPAAGSLIAAPCEVLFVMAPSPGLSLLGLTLQSFFGGLCMPALYAACLSLARVRMRTLASALFLLAVNLVGQAVGPVAIGAGTDALAGQYGQMAIRHSMLIVMPLSSLLAGLCFLWASWLFAAGTARAAAVPAA